MARILLLGVLAVSAACTTSAPRRASLSSAELLSGSALPTPIAARAPLSPDDVFAIDAEMRDFVAAEVGGSKGSDAVLRKLLAAMKDRGLFSLDYTQDATRTPRATFHERQGNCISFTMLFVALAREAGLDVRYQTVNVPPNWSSEGGLVIVNTHINARVDTPFRNSLVVDFNEMQLTGDYEMREVTDSHALALFYNNLGAEALIRQDYDLSFLYLKQAIDTHPILASPWVGLGLLYARLMRYEHAEGAYLQALEREPGNRSALTNLANLYTTLGNQELANVYRERVHHYQLRNPYYYFSIAQKAYAQRAFDDALVALKKAVRLKRDEHQFYFLRGLVYLDIGEKPQAQINFVRARNYATRGEIRAQYDARIEALAEGG